MRQFWQRLAHQRQIAFILQPLSQISKTLYAEGLPSLWRRGRQIVAEPLEVGRGGLLQLTGQFGVQAGHLGLGRAEGVGVLRQTLGLLFVELAGQLVAQGFHHLIHEVFGAAGDEQTALVEGKLEKPQVVTGFGRLEEVDA